MQGFQVEMQLMWANPGSHRLAQGCRERKQVKMMLVPLREKIPAIRVKFRPPVSSLSGTLVSTWSVVSPS